MSGGGGDGLVVGGDDDSGAVGLLDLLEEIDDCIYIVMVEVAGGFVGDENGRIVVEGTGDGGTLDLTARKFGGEMVEMIG